MNSEETLDNPSSKALNYPLDLPPSEFIVIDFSNLDLIITKFSPITQMKDRNRLMSTI